MLKKKDDEPGSISGSGSYAYESDGGNFKTGSEVEVIVESDGKTEVKVTAGLEFGFSKSYTRE